MKDLILGNTELQSRVILAPMAGVTDLPFRKIVREIGNFLMYSEMVASQAVIRNVKRTHKMMDNADDELTSVQLVGADPKIMAQAAKLSYDLGARFLDINMGCPVKKIVKSDAGSALMKNEKLAASIIESVVNSVPIPVTLKIRLGWDMEHKNAAEIAKIAEKAGIQMISVHGRTRSQLYSGKANWIEVGNVKNAVNIPVLVNGDIVDINSANIALQESHADGVMIGRGALGSPWILKDIDNFIKTGNTQYALVSDSEKKRILKKHLNYMFEFYETSTAIKMSRRVMMYYCHGTKNASKIRQKINFLNTIEEIFDLIK
ncbi:MAG: tRNA dihydrouridine synthase DusB [Alphaproteobacteria bacterium]|nr:tRNA dihydrouridine synthase DusB [Alphaproteobacteria bacterium]